MPNAKILIVEDEAIEALDIQQRLMALGYPLPDIAYSGEEGVRKAAAARPDLVLMDIMMPGGLDGVAAAGQIQALFDIPIIYLTAYADEDTLQRAKITAPYGYIVKPFQERELHITVDVALYKHEMQKRLKEREEWLGTTLKSIGDAVIATDAGGLVTFMNPVAEHLTGWRSDEAQGRSLTEVFRIVNRDTRAAVENPVLKVLREGTAAGLANHTVLVARNGAEIGIDDSAAPIKDDQGAILGVVLVFRDVSERQRAETERERMVSELDAQRVLLDAVIEHSPVAISIAEASSGRILRINEEARRIWGADSLTPGDLQGYAEKFAVYHLDGRSYRSDERPLGRALRGEEVRGETLGFVRADGVRGLVRSSAVPIRDGTGKIVAAMAVGEDITREKEAERALRRTAAELARSNEDLAEFARICSHDLQEPLRTMGAFAQLLNKRCRGQLDERTAGYLSGVVQGVHRMQALIDDLLAYSRAASEPETLAPTQAQDALGAALANLTLAIEEAGARVSHDSLPTVVVDGVQLAQLFQNLIGNALRFRRPGVAPEIHVSAGRAGTEDGGEEGGWRFSVRDNGIGIEPRFHAKIFEAFQRLHGRGKYAGSGMGLAICKRIVERHEGRIWVESRPGNGSTFFFVLPDALPARRTDGDGRGDEIGRDKVPVPE